MLPDTRPSLSQLFWTFLRIGAMGFGGVFALVSLQQKVIVQQRGWMSTEEFLASSGVGALAPGPLSSNITAVVGYRLRGLAGGAVAYAAYHLPALAAVLVLSVYFRHVESLPVVRGALRGVTAAVIGLLFGVLWSPHVGGQRREQVRRLRQVFAAVDAARRAASVVGGEH